MAHGRYPVSAYDLLRNHQTICSVDALKAPTRRCLAPALSTAVSRPDPRCTVAASQISIAPPDRGAHSPAVSFPAAFERRPGRLRACGELYDGAGIRNPSHYRKYTQAPRRGQFARTNRQLVARCPRRLSHVRSELFERCPLSFRLTRRAVHTPLSTTGKRTYLPQFKSICFACRRTMRGGASRVLQDLLAIQCWPLWIRVALMWVGLGAAYLVQIPMERRRGCGAVWNFPLTG